LILNTVMPNGVRILLEPVPATEIISIGFWFLHGSRDEVKEEEGYSHFLEHMLFKGTKKRSTFRIAQEIDRVGGGINAFTEKEITCLHCTVPKEHFHLAADVLADIVFYSELPSEEISREKIVIINELKASEDNPEEKSFDLFLERFWSDHPLGKRIIGRESSIKNASQDLLVRFYRKYFIPRNLIISVAGDFKEQEVIKTFSDLITPQQGEMLPRTRIPPQRVIHRDFIPDKFQQAHFYYGTYLRSTSTIRDYYIQLLLSTCFGESMSSRLFQEIREKQGLCYSIFTSRIYYTDIGLWIIYANTFPELIKELLDNVSAELKKLGDAPPCKEEVEDARSHIKGTLILSQPDLEVRMKRIARQYIIMKELLTYEESITLVDSITLEEVQK
jgi:predicted Zn-dependent peptidase